MAFNSPLFLAFFVLFFALYNFVASSKGRRLWLITWASLAFYGAWNYRFVPILLGAGLASYWAARLIAKAPDERRRKRWLVAGVTADLAALGFFKYAGFFKAWPLRAVMLPVGMSFYTFQCISYKVDVYRRVLEPCGRLDEFLAALTFFPRLAAGPLVRWPDWLPQFEELKPPSWNEVKQGFLLIAFGLVKKTIADLLTPAADALFFDGPHSVLESWTGALAFAGQIYGDFAGYTDMAIGVALLLGFSLPPNFNLPFLAGSPIEFWRRWHISLYTWLYDYLYLPLVFKCRLHPYLSLMITLLLSGLWHGAKWTFVLVGVYHGLLLAAAHWISSRLAEDWRNLERLWFVRAARIAMTFYFVLLGWVIFRADSIPQAWGVWRGMHWPAQPPPADGGSTMTLALVLAAIAFCHGIDYAAKSRKAMGNPLAVWPAAVTGFAFSFALGYAGKTFIYFRF